MSKPNFFEMPTVLYMFKKKPWQDYLRGLNPRPAFYINEDDVTISEQHDAISLQRMQDHSPGNYTLEKYYDEYHGYSYRLKFDTPHDETFFRLKYT
jgi:hypothetical protein